jgi:bifunctional non-homologous end joining protein LigD
VTAKLDPAAHTVRTIPARLAKLKKDPWAGFAEARQHLPELKGTAPAPSAEKPRTASRVVVARKPTPRKSRVRRTEN